MEKNKNHRNNSEFNDMQKKTQHSKSTDSAPADEAQQMNRFVQETQKGKNKVDGDPSQDSDRPVEQ